MYFRIAFMISFLTLCFTTALSQAAPDLGILWQKENIGVDIQFAKFSKDGQFVYCATETNILKMSAETGEILSTFDKSEVPPMYVIYTMEISGKGNYITTLDGYGNVVIWDTRTEKAIKQITFGENSKDSSSSYAVISPDEKFLLIPLSFNGLNPPHYLKIFNMETYTEINRIEISGHVDRIQFTHDGKYFATGITYKDNFTQKWFNKIVLWETGTWKQVAVLEDIEGDLAGYRHLKFSPNDQYLGSVRALPHDAHIYDLNTKMLIKSSDAEKDCYQIGFLPDSNHFLLTFYDINTNERTLELHDFEKQIKTYPVPAAIIESFNNSGNWKIFCCTNWYVTFFLNKPNIVTENNPDNNITLFYENDKIIIETTNFNSPKLNILINDITGKNIYKEIKSVEQGNSRFIIEILLPVGVYLAKVNADNKYYSFKINVVR